MWAASSMARASTERIFPSSNIRTPPIVHPAGVVTSSRKAAGWRPVVCTMRAAPTTVCVTRSIASFLGNPTRTPASAIASIIR